MCLCTLLLLCTLSCEKDDDSNDNNDPLSQLPPATMTGENTFGCLINGDPFVVTNTSNQVAIYQGGFLQFGADGIFMTVNDPITINTEYELIGMARYFVDNNPNIGCHYQFEDSYSGRVVFSKIDTQNFIVSGTFEFSTVNQDCENIDIMAGRFDLQYIP